MLFQGDDYTTGCLLDYTYFKENYILIAMNLSKQKALDIDPKIIKQINFTGNLDWTWNTKIFIIIEEVKYTILDISRGTVRVHQFLIH